MYLIVYLLIIIEYFSIFVKKIKTYEKFKITFTDANERINY